MVIILALLPITVSYWVSCLISLSSVANIEHRYSQFYVSGNGFFLNLHEIMEVLYFFHFYYTSTKSWTGYIFTENCFCVCVCVCVCVSVCLSVSEQNSRLTDAPIWTWFSLNGWSPHWLGSYRNWLPWFAGQGHGDSILPFFLHKSPSNLQLWISAI